MSSGVILVFFGIVLLGIAIYIYYPSLSTTTDDGDETGDETGDKTGNEIVEETTVGDECVYTGTDEDPNAKYTLDAAGECTTNSCLDTWFKDSNDRCAYQDLSSCPTGDVKTKLDGIWWDKKCNQPLSECTSGENVKLSNLIKGDSGNPNRCEIAADGCENNYIVNANRNACIEIPLEGASCTPPLGKPMYGTSTFKYGPLAADNTADCIMQNIEGTDRGCGEGFLRNPINDDINGRPQDWCYKVGDPCMNMTGDYDGNAIYKFLANGSCKKYCMSKNYGKDPEDYGEKELEDGNWLPIDENAEIDPGMCSYNQKGKPCGEGLNGDADGVLGPYSYTYGDGPTDCVQKCADPNKVLVDGSCSKQSCEIENASEAYIDDNTCIVQKCNLGWMPVSGNKSCIKSTDFKDQLSIKIKIRPYENSEQISRFDIIYKTYMGDFCNIEDLEIKLYQNETNKRSTFKKYITDIDLSPMSTTLSINNPWPVQRTYDIIKDWGNDKLFMCTADVKESPAHSLKTETMNKTTITSIVSKGKKGGEIDNLAGNSDVYFVLAKFGNLFTKCDSDHLFSTESRRSTDILSDVRGVSSRDLIKINWRCNEGFIYTSKADGTKYGDPEKISFSLSGIKAYNPYLNKVQGM